MRKELVTYIETSIIPLYREFDAAHNLSHVRDVIEGSSLIVKALDDSGINEEMVYVTAAFHDLGLCDGREMHHISSGRIVRQDPHLPEWFTQEEIETIACAVEDHRASSSSVPRSIFGMIVAEADRHIEPMDILRRTVQYGFSHYPELDKEGHYNRMVEHMAEKYAESGYLRLWIPQSPNAEGLRRLREIINSPSRLRAVFDDIYEEEEKKK